MNCLNYDNKEKYISEINKLNDKEKREQYELSSAIINHIEYDYNLLKATIYLKFLLPIRNFLRKNISIDDLKKAVYDCFNYCIDNNSYFLHFHSSIEDKNEFEYVEKREDSPIEIIDGLIDYLYDETHKNYDRLMNLYVSFKEFSNYVFRKLSTSHKNFENQIQKFEKENHIKTGEDIYHTLQSVFKRTIFEIFLIEEVNHEER